MCSVYYEQADMEKMANNIQNGRTKTIMYVKTFMSFMSTSLHSLCISSSKAECVCFEGQKRRRFRAKKISGNHSDEHKTEMQFYWIKDYKFGAFQQMTNI